MPCNAALNEFRRAMASREVLEVAAAERKKSRDDDQTDEVGESLGSRGEEAIDGNL